VSSVPPEPTPLPNLRELESLRIAHTAAPRRRRLWPLLIVVIVVAALAAGGYEAYVHTLGRPLEVQTASAALLAAQQPSPLISGSGYIVTRDKYITVGTKILGQIIAEPIEEGSHVRKGDLLAQIDDRDYQAQLRQALADRQQAAANLGLAQAKARRARVLFGQRVISQDSSDVAENALAVAQADLGRADAEIAYARFNVGQCVIVSPIDGVVLQKYSEVGDTINYGGDIRAGGGATDIAQLADTGDMRVEATVVLDAYPDLNLDARVVKIYPEADRQKGTIKVEVKILKPDLPIVRPEMSAKITFLAAPAITSQQPIVVIPKNAAITSGGQRYVWIVRDGRARQAPVLTGRELESGVEVKSGLGGGETVIVSPPDSLKNGQPVTAKPA
jgi:RND family efflux transporter MFP subunit